MSYKIVTIIECEEWAAMYIDSKLTKEGHTIKLFDIPENEPIIFEYYYEDSKELNDYIEENSGFPTNFEVIDEILGKD